MSLYRIALCLTLIFMTLIAGLALFAILVPMNFHVDAQGRVEPGDVRRLESPLAGTIATVTAAKTFKKGDILFSLTDRLDRERLAILDERETLLRAELERLKVVADQERKLRQWELDQTKFDLDKATMELDMQSKQLRNYTVMADNLKQQKKLDQDLKNKEAAILSTLYEKHVLTKMDYLRIMYEKSMAAAAAQEIDFRTQQGLFDNSLREKQIDAEEDTLIARLKHLRDLPETIVPKFTVENQLLEVRRERLELKERIELKTSRSPFDGVVLSTRPMQAGDRVDAGDVVLEIASAEKPRFIAWINQNHRHELRTGMKAELYLDNYFFHKYGVMTGVVEDIQTYLGNGADAESTTAKYQLKISIDNPFRTFEPGLTGTAKIIVFHGTLVEYVMDAHGGGMLVNEENVASNKSNRALEKDEANGK